MKVEFKNNNAYIAEMPDFDLEQTFTCGQCFRWNKTDENSFTGVAYGKVLKISMLDGGFILHGVTDEDYYNIWEEYFDLSRNYGEIKKTLAIDEVMENAISAGSGIRILRQDIWETILSFIISASNNIPRIKKIITSLCENFGEPLSDGLYSFPAPEKLRGITPEDLAPIRAGFRAKYIADAADKITSGEVDLDGLFKMDTASARKELIKINGIGNKVADCILLFALGRMEVFPVDVWINNTMCKLYPEKCTSLAGVRIAGPEIFGEYCGVAQQYLFYYARENGGDI